jgi:hypothetical protein
MRLLLADRGNNGAAWFEVLRVINWTHDDDFERAVVLSPAKLRSRFTALKLKADKPLRVVSQSKDTTDNLIQGLRDSEASA